MKVKTPVRRLKNTPAIYDRILHILESARSSALRSVNTSQVVANWLVGREIVEEEQKGKKKAGYGETLLEELAALLTKDFGPGYSGTNLRWFRQFYVEYPALLPEEIHHALRDKSSNRLSPGRARIHHALRDESSDALWPLQPLSLGDGKSWTPGLLHPNLSWTHYRTLLRVDKAEARSFYEIEALRNNWAARELERQINSLLELGRGFAFVARQQRITLDGDHFYIDLVFYHTILKCYILIDLKVGKLTHNDLGQIQLYVNYFDKERRAADDNPSLGLILCTDKNDAVVKYTLGENRQDKIFASRYKLYLPTAAELKAELRREISAIDRTSGGGAP